MAVAYTRDFLIDAFVSRYEPTYQSQDQRVSHRKLAEDLYDRVGKEKFRTYASLDAEAVRKFKLDRSS